MPIQLELLRKVTHVYTHAHCPDGMASAMILKDAFRMLGTSPRIEFLAHGTPEHKHASMGEQEGYALWCDFAPDPIGLRDVKPGELQFVVLDHHKGTEDLVRSFGELGVFADEKLEPGVSGAFLAYREVWLPIVESLDHPPLPDFETSRKLLLRVREFATAVGARDTWQTKDSLFQRGQWISKMLMSKPASHWLDSIGASSFDRVHGGLRGGVPYLGEDEVLVGRALFEAHEEAVRQAVEQCVMFEDDTWGNVILYVFQEQASGFRLCSDVAEAHRSLMRVDGSAYKAVIAGFSYVVDKPGAEPRLLYSLRGLNGFDVAAFAKANGGGGHTAAAGFSMSIRSNGIGTAIVMTDPYEELRRRLETFLICGAGTSS